jgi:hypothetical protein
MISRSGLNFIVDSVAGLAFILSVFSGRSYYVHIVAGTAMTAAIIVHLGLHWNWLVDCSRKLLVGSMSGRRRMKVNYTLDLFIAAMFAISMASGFGLLFSNTTVISKTHGLSSWMFVLGSAVHVVLHWKWIVTMIRSRPTKSNHSPRVARPVATLQQESSQRDGCRIIVSGIGEFRQSGKHEGEIS